MRGWLEITKRQRGVYEYVPFVRYIRILYHFFPRFELRTPRPQAITYCSGIMIFCQHMAKALAICKALFCGQSASHHLSVLVMTSWIAMLKVSCNTKDRSANAKSIQILWFGWEWKVRNLKVTKNTWHTNILWLLFNEHRLGAPSPFFWCVLINGEVVGFWRIDVSELKEAMKLMGEDDPSSPFWNTASWPCKMALALLFWFISWEDLNDDEVNALFTAVDHDGNDAISFEEFCVLARFSVIFLCWISWDCEF